MYSKLDGDRQEGIPTGHVRVLLVGDAGVGKSSIAQLIANGACEKDVERTIGCSVHVKLVKYPLDSFGKNSYQDFFVELWDVAGSDWYKDCRSLFYSQINGIIFVHDLSQRKTKANLQKWATEVASLGSFTAPLASLTMGLVPVPFLVIGNKGDLAPKTGGSSSNLVDVARQWVEKQGLLTPADELPTSETFPGTQGLRAVAKEGELDVEAVDMFFLTVLVEVVFVFILVFFALSQLIRRRYFGEGHSLGSLNLFPKQQPSTFSGSHYLSKANSSRYRM